VYRNFAPRLKKKNGTKSYSPASWNGNYSLAEVLGRLVYCGFEIINYKQNDQLTYFIVRKKSGPRSELVSVSRFIVRLKRVGKSGRIIDIYKIRSMYPYSEFLQDYVVKINGYDIMGKPKNDFRLTSCGRIIRKLWIDEIPQIYNLIRGDISLVGVRPISRYGFNALPADLQDKRIMNKPGLISPHVSLRFQGFDGVIRAERKYLEERGISPVKTNIRYFFLAVFNILTLRVKSS
jgi:lipopolysaccharide/colanic/teichoic acid biosynthesis glycosyltransferase